MYPIDVSIHYGADGRMSARWLFSAGKLARKSGYKWLTELKGARKKGLWSFLKHLKPALGGSYQFLWGGYRWQSGHKRCLGTGPWPALEHVGNSRRMQGAPGPQGGGGKGDPRKVLCVTLSDFECNVTPGCAPGNFQRGEGCLVARRRGVPRGT